jgi:Zn finger protein HypA/HybF involved in hydrogenase expression
MSQTITRNAVRCLKCNTVIESRSVHDFCQCPCGSIAVDGGKEYLRRVGNSEDIEELSEYSEV